MNINPINNNVQPNFQAKFKNFPNEWVKTLKLEAMRNKKTYELMDQFEKLPKNIEIEVKLLPGIDNYKLRNTLTEVCSEPSKLLQCNTDANVFETFFSKMLCCKELLYTPTEESVKSIDAVITKILSKGM